MSIKATCPDCGNKATFKDESAGKKAKCGVCGTVFRLPPESNSSKPKGSLKTPKRPQERSQLSAPKDDEEIDWNSISELESKGKALSPLKAPASKKLRDREPKRSSKASAKTKRNRIIIGSILALHIVPSIVGAFFATNNPDAAGVVLLVQLAIDCVVLLAGIWGVFEKAGHPGWASLVPIYNYMLLLEIADCPTWWLIFLLCCPGINSVVMIIVFWKIATNFGRGPLFAICLILMPSICFPILAFVDD